MTRKATIKPHSDGPSVLGDAAAADRLLHSAQSKQFTGDPLGRELYSLIALHPDLPVRFRELNIQELDDKTKQVAIDGIRSFLGIPH